MRQTFIWIHLYDSITTHENAWHKTSIEALNAFFLVHFFDYLFYDLRAFHFLVIAILLEKHNARFDSPEGSRYRHWSKTSTITDENCLPAVRLTRVIIVSLFTVWVNIEEYAIGKWACSSVNDDATVQRKEALWSVHGRKCMVNASVGRNGVVLG